MKSLRCLVSLVAVATVASIVGCGSKEPAKSPASTSTSGDAAPMSSTPEVSSTPAPAPMSTRESTKSDIYLDEAIVKACGIASTDAFFGFDSAHVDSASTRVVDLVAACFTSGPLKGRKMQLVGHADPRGDNDYNFRLGQERSDAVQSVLRARGLSSSQSTSTSRGAMDATGTDEASWAHDRRVDVKLVS